MTSKAEITRLLRADTPRLGIDLGGTKISIIAMRPDGHVLHHARRPTPRHDYEGVIAAIAGLVRAAEDAIGAASALPVGIGMPGSISPATGRVQNANSTWLNGRAFAKDLQAALQRPVRLANDANCLALSEATDGAAAGADTVFGVILGTGCGGGLVHAGRIIAGRNRIGGEWGHNPLPWPRQEEWPGPRCWCGRRGCLETWISGSGLERDFREMTGRALKGEDIVAAASSGDAAAREALARHADRLARGLAHVVNIFDPEVIVIGGGLSALPGLIEDLPERMRPHVFADAPRLTIRRARHGPDSGVRGAARLWDIADADWVF
jgi:fructokinase